MESIIAFLIGISLFLYAGLTIFETSLKTQEAITESWVEMESRATFRANTAVVPTDVAVMNGGSVVEVTLKNSGSSRVTDFDHWDVMFQYYDNSDDYYISWYPFASGGNPNNKWQVEGIYVDAASSTAEVFEPGILNPSEEIVIRLRVSPSIGSNTINMISIGTTEGITTSTLVER